MKGNLDLVAVCLFVFGCVKGFGTGTVFFFFLFSKGTIHSTLNITRIIYNDRTIEEEREKKTRSPFTG